MLAIRFLLFTLLIGGLAALGGFAWYANHLADVPAAEAPPAKVAILVASHTLRVGSLVKPEDLASKDVSPAEVTPDEKRDTSAMRGELVGALVRHSIEAEQPILPDSVLRPGDYGFLAAVLTPGMRASTIGVDAVSGSAGLIWPGDHVDVILTQQLDDPNLPPGRKVSAETLLSDVRVIAIDQQLTQGATAAATDQTVRTATLEVTPEQAERIAVATRLGHLVLDLRSATPTASAAQAAAGPPTAQAGAGTASVTTNEAPATTAQPPAPGQVAPAAGAPVSATGGALPTTAAGSVAQGGPGPAVGSTAGAAIGSAGAPHGVTWGGDVSAALGNAPAPAAAPHPSVRVYSGAHDGKEVKF
ncbi:MAG TPA: Flp pilus assembly protein CpaB [Acidisphaera sp.]|nr:Flp pilus assembly protein CpaB [Acidisphaera sp.]